MVEFGLNFDAPLVFFDYSLGNRKSESNAFGLGGEKRIEDAIKQTLFDPGSLIFHGYGQEGPHRDMVGHDVNYLSYAGVLDLIGGYWRSPITPS